MRVLNRLHFMISASLLLGHGNYYSFLSADIPQGAGLFLKYSCGFLQLLLDYWWGSLSSTNFCLIAWWSCQCSPVTVAHGWWCFWQLWCHCLFSPSYTMDFCVQEAMNFPVIKSPHTLAFRMIASWKQPLWERGWVILWQLGWSLTWCFR